MRKWFKKKYRDYEILPDEIFLDTANVSRLDTQQFEGVIEKPITQKTLYILGTVFLLSLVFFAFRLTNLQIIHGEAYLKRSENNRLNHLPLFAERGVIYDRNNKEIAWNSVLNEEADFSRRAYTELTGHGHLLGYVNYPIKDANGFYWRTDIEGVAGLERKYNTLLSGENGARLIEVDALNTEISNNTITLPVHGENLHTTIDTLVQHYLYDAIKTQATEGGFIGGSGSIMDIHSGELIAFTSYPEFDPYILAEGKEIETIEGFFNDPGKPFLNRVISGLYSPGSTIKPILGIAGLHEGVITENTSIMSTGRIEIPNRFNPSEPSIFRDWRPQGHGRTDIYHAISDSVNTFFYMLGGGYQSYEGLGIGRIEEYIQMFGISEPTGIDFGSEPSGTIPTPEWKERVFEDGVWRLGDTYNTSIGQFGFQVTPLQMTRAFAAIGNKGTLVTPLLIKGTPLSKRTTENISDEHYIIIHQALRETITKGSGRILNVPYVTIAGKTGTAQVGVNNEFFNSWIVGFFPYENPQYSFSIAMERAPRESEESASRAMRKFLDDIELHYPEFWDSLE